jgi:hypothetical protein
MAQGVGRNPFVNLGSSHGVSNSYSEHPSTQLAMASFEKPLFRMVALILFAQNIQRVM